MSSKTRLSIDEVYTEDMQVMGIYTSDNSG